MTATNNVTVQLNLRENDFLFTFLLVLPMVVFNIEIICKDTNKKWTDNYFSHIITLSFTPSLTSTPRPTGIRQASSRHHLGII
jgi:hypothetical protein